MSIFDRFRKNIAEELPKKISSVTHACEEDPHYTHWFTYFLIEKSDAMKLFPKADFSRSMVTSGGQYVIGYAEYFTFNILQTNRITLRFAAHDLSPAIATFIDALPPFPPEEEFGESLDSDVPLLQFFECLYVAPPFREQGAVIISEMIRIIDLYGETEENGVAIATGCVAVPQEAEEEHFTLPINTQEPLWLTDAPPGPECDRVRALLAAYFDDGEEKDGIYYCSYWATEDYAGEE